MQWPRSTNDTCEYCPKRFELLLGRVSCSCSDHFQSKIFPRPLHFTHAPRCKNLLFEKITSCKIHLSISMCHLAQLSTIGIVPFSYVGHLISNLICHRFQRISKHVEKICSHLIGHWYCPVQGIQNGHEAALELRSHCIVMPSQAVVQLIPERLNRLTQIGPWFDHIVTFSCFAFSSFSKRTHVCVISLRNSSVLLSDRCEVTVSSHSSPCHKIGSFNFKHVLSITGAPPTSIKP